MNQSRKLLCSVSEQCGTNWLSSRQQFRRKNTPIHWLFANNGNKSGDYYLASTGLTETEGLFFPQTLASIIVRQPAPPLQHGTEILGKLIYDKVTQRVLGAQLCSKTIV